MISVNLSNKIGKYTTFVCAILIITITMSIILLIAYKGLATFTRDGVSLHNFFLTSKWNPDATPAEGGPFVGAADFIAGSVAVSLLALLFSAPFAIGIAIFMAEISTGWGRKTHAAGDRVCLWVFPRWSTAGSGSACWCRL